MTSDNVTRAGFWLCAVAGTALVAAPALTAEVTSKRLLEAQNEPQNWLLPYGSYNNHNHSSLAQINRSNVGNLRMIYMVGLGGADHDTNVAFQGVPAVNDGLMFVTDPWSVLVKFDVSSGSGAKVLWRFDPEIERGAGALRGTPALLGNSVFINTKRDHRLISVDADSGEVNWEVTMEVPGIEEPDQSMSMLPMVVKNNLMALGVGAVDGGSRGRVAAYSADDGSFVWQFFTVPGPGEVGHETWVCEWECWRTGGTGMWIQPAYDPETNLVYYGTGEPNPWYEASYRPGDNLFSVSTIALDVDTGKLAWYFQQVPDETWDYDNVNPQMLYDITVNGQNRRVVSQFARNGFYYSNDRVTGEFVFASPYTEVNWTAGLDPKTGMPVEYDPSALIQSYANNSSLVAGDSSSAQNVCPYFYGMPTLMPPTYDAKRQMAYLGAQEGCFSQVRDEPAEKKWEPGYSAGGAERTHNQVNGAVFAVDGRTSQLVMKANLPYSIYSGTLGTAGDLLFMGQTDGKFMALDKDTLSELWAFNTGTPLSSPPMSFSVGGKQYVAILAGGQSNLSGISGQEELGLLGQAPAILAFGL